MLQTRSKSPSWRPRLVSLSLPYFLEPQVPQSADSSTDIDDKGSIFVIARNSDGGWTRAVLYLGAVGTSGCSIDGDAGGASQRWGSRQARRRRRRFVARIWLSPATSFISWQDEVKDRPVWSRGR